MLLTVDINENWISGENGNMYIAVIMVEDCPTLSNTESELTNLFTYQPKHSGNTNTGQNSITQVPG